MIEYKSVSFRQTDLRETEDSWTICGHICTYDVDRKRERIIRGAPDARLRARHDNRVDNGLMSGVNFLWQHDGGVIIGYPTVMVPDSEGVYVEATFLKDEDFPEARRAYKLAKLGLITQFSVGYIVYRERKGQDEYGPVRELLDMDILEFSLVTIAMNPRAEVSEVKSCEVKVVEDMDKFELEFKSLREEVAALRDTVGALVTGMASTPGQTASAVQDILAQFSAQIQQAQSPAEAELIAEIATEDIMEVIAECEDCAEEETPQEDTAEGGVEEEDACKPEMDGMAEQGSGEVVCPNCVLCGKSTKVETTQETSVETTALVVEEKSAAAVVEAPVEEDSEELKGLLSYALELKNIICEGQSHNE